MNERNRRHEEGLYYERKKKELEKGEWIMKKECDMIKKMMI